MPTKCLQTGGSVTLDVTDANGVTHHIMIVLHPLGEPPLDPSEPIFRTYMGGPSERAAYLTALMEAKEPTSPAVLLAKRTCITNPYGAIDLSIAAGCVADQLEPSSVFNGAPPRAVALVALVPEEGWNILNPGAPSNSVSSKICLERVPDATVVDENGNLQVDPVSIIFNLYVLHPQPSSIP